MQLKNISLICGVILTAILCIGAGYDIPTATINKLRVGSLRISNTASPSTDYNNSFFVTQDGAGDHDGSSADNAWSVAEFNAETSPTGGDAVYFDGTITTKVAPICNGISSAHLYLYFTNASLAVGATARQIEFIGNSYITAFGGTFADAQNNGECIALVTNQCRDIVLDGFRANQSYTNIGQFISSLCVSNLVVRNCYVTNTGCFVFTDWSTLGWGQSHHISISNSVAISSTNEIGQTDIIQLGNASVVYIQGNLLIHKTPGNSDTDRHQDILQTFKSGGSTYSYPHSWTIRYNWFRIDTQGSHDNASVSYTMLEDLTNSGGFALKVYGNIFDHTYDSELQAGFGAKCVDDSQQMYVYNNTFVYRDGPCAVINFSVNVDGLLYLENNIGTKTNLWGQCNQIYTTDVVEGNYDYNWLYYFNADGGVLENAIGTNGESEEDPKVISIANANYALAEDSPCIDAGNDSIGAEYSWGISTNATWPNPALTERKAGHWDVGAYQRPN